MQTVYLKILQGKARYSGRASFRTWLFSVIRKTAAEERRRSFFRRLKLREYEQQSRQTNPHDSSRQRIDPSEELFMFQEALTDFLLEVPGDHLLRTAPQFDYLTLEMGRFPSEQNPRRSGSAL